MPSDAMQPPKTNPADLYNDHDAIKELVRRKRDEWSKGREDFVRAAYRNILFYRSRQWIKWSRETNRFRPAILPKGTPTPVTNVFAPTMDAVMSVFARIEPRLNFAPGNPEEPEDRAAADVATRAINVVEDEVSIRLQRQMLAAWVTLTGQAWLENGYDPDTLHGMVTIDAEQCPKCKSTQPAGAEACESCGQPAPLIPTQMTAPRGKQYVDVCSIFEMFFDASITEWTRQRRYIREKTVSEDEAKGRWKHLADQIQGHVIGGMDEWYAEALPTLGPQIDDANTSRMLLQTTQHQGRRVLEQWYWQMPDDKYPEGLLAVIVARTHVGYAGPLPYGALQADGSRKPFLPTVHFPQHLVPGSGFAKTVADDVALSQAKRNRWESIIEACGMRIGSPVWLNPNGSGIKNFSGEPSAVHNYNPIPGSNAKPERIPGQGIPLSFIQRIEKIDREIEQQAATFDVIKGARPEGVSAGIALQILQERGMSRFGPLFIMWEAAWAQQAYQMLEIFRQFATEERLLRIKGRDGGWEVQKFVGADLSGRVDVIPEAGSSMPRSTMVERAEMEQAFALRLLSPAEPEVRFKALEKFGMTHFLEGLKADTKNAIRENEAFLELAKNPLWQQAIPQDTEALRDFTYPEIAAIMEQKFHVKLPRVRAAVDDHATHSREHGNFLKSESAQKMPEIVQIIAEKMKEYHDTLMIQQAQALQGLQPGQQQGGFMAKPAAMVQPMNTSSSPERMGGDFAELENNMTSTPGSAMQ